MTTELECVSCGQPRSAHCKIHMIPCCPGKCPGKALRPTPPPFVRCDHPNAYAIGGRAMMYCPSCGIFSAMEE